MTVREIGRLLRDRSVSCAELIEKTLTDIKTRDPILNSFITLTEEEAHRQARERDKDLAAGIDRGPLHGVPVAYKDLFYTRGTRTTGGSLIFRDFVPDYDATVVEKLKQAGAICVGKTNLHELAYGITSRNPHFGPVLNPVDRNRIPGGSSGGSAVAVAADFVPIAIGTDTGGSIRIPASYCGVVGLKPTYDLLSRRGVLPLATSLDHVGPIGSCVEDCALAMQAMNGHEVASEPLRDLGGVRVGVPKNFFFDHVSEDVAVAVHQSVSEMARRGAFVSEIQVPDLAAANLAARVIQLAEVAALYAHHCDSSLFGEDLWRLIQQGKTISGHDYVNAQRLRTLFRHEFDALWENVDILAAPTTPITAPEIGKSSVMISGEEEDARMASTRLVRALNFTGEPALSMPCGRTAAGLPIGLQLVSAPFSDSKLLRIARTVETFLD